MNIFRKQQKKARTARNLTVVTTESFHWLRTQAVLLTFSELFYSKHNANQTDFTAQRRRENRNKNDYNKVVFYRIYSRQDTTLREYLTRVSGFAAKLKSTVETKEPKPKPKTQTLNHKT